MAKPLDQMTLEEKKRELAFLKSAKEKHLSIKDVDVAREVQGVNPSLQAFALYQRDAETNKLQKGVKTSHHLTGDALDFSTNPQIEERARQVGLNALRHNAGSGMHSHVDGAPDISKMSLEEKQHELNYLRSLKQSNEAQPQNQVGQAANVPQQQSGFLDKVKQGASEIAGLTVPGQLYSAHQQRKQILNESASDPRTSLESLVRGAANTMFVGQAPKLNAAIGSALGEGQYDTLLPQYQKRYETVAQDQPTSSGLGSQVIQQAVLGPLANKLVPAAGIPSAPESLLKSVPKGLMDIIRGAVVGGAPAVAGTYGVQPDEDISLGQRVAAASPSVLMGGVMGGAPRLANKIGRDVAAQKGFQNQKEQNIINATNKADDLMNQRIAAYDDVSSNPNYTKATVDIDQFWNDASQKVNQIKAKTPSSWTTDEKNYVKQYSSWEKDLANAYGKEANAPLVDGGYLLGTKKSKQLQTKEIPFNEVTGINKVLNEEYGKEGFSTILGTLKNSLNETVESTTDKALLNKWREANKLYGKEKETLRSIKDIEKSKLPKPELGKFKQAALDISSAVPNIVGGDVLRRTIRNSGYNTYGQPTATQQVVESAKPYAQGLADILSTILSINALKPTQAFQQDQ